MDVGTGLICFIDDGRILRSVVDFGAFADCDLVVGFTTFADVAMVVGLEGKGVGKLALELVDGYAFPEVLAIGTLGDPEVECSESKRLSIAELPYA